MNHIKLQGIILYWCFFYLLVPPLPSCISWVRNGNRPLSRFHCDELGFRDD